MGNSLATCASAMTRSISIAQSLIASGLSMALYGLPNSTKKTRLTINPEEPDIRSPRSIEQNKKKNTSRLVAMQGEFGVRKRPNAKMQRMKSNPEPETQNIEAQTCNMMRTKMDQHSLNSERLQVHFRLSFGSRAGFGI